MAFAADLQAFKLKVAGRVQGVFAGCVAEVKTSIVEGSPLSAAPGQPWDTGNLAGSWGPTFPEKWVGLVATDVEYAEAIEEGQQAPYTTSTGTPVTPRPITQPYPSGGGPHSVKLTRAAWPNIVEHVRRTVVGE